MKKYGWLAVTLVGTVVSFYGNYKVKQAVVEENSLKGFKFL